MAKELPSHIGNRVRFGAPKDVHLKKGGPAWGTILDEVWADKAINSSDCHSKKCSQGMHCWGDYSFCSQLIKWDEAGADGEYSIRLAYYRRRCGEDKWMFAGQTTVTSDCASIRKLLEATLARKTWFQNPPVPNS